jgi:hypothetical protein
VSSYHKGFFSFSVALQSLKDLGRLTYRRFLELFRHMVGLRRRVISPSQGLYLHRTTQHRKTRTNIHALSGIRTHDPGKQPAKTHASDRTASLTGCGVQLYSSIPTPACSVPLCFMTVMNLFKTETACVQFNRTYLSII